MPVEDDDAFVASLPAAVRAEIADWIAWQRRYQAARNSGASDHEAHRIASVA